MNCEYWEQAIAFSVDGEPAPPGLEAHLAQCATCRDLHEALLADQAALRRWPAAADSAARDLHAAIMRRVRRPRVPRLAWYAAAAAIVLVFLAIRFRPAQVPKPLPNRIAIVKPVRPPVPASPASVAAVRHIPHKTTTAHKPVKPAPPAITDAEWRQLLDEFLSTPKPPAMCAPASDVAIRIQTSDPDVVILWLQEKQGGADE